MHDDIKGISNILGNEKVLHHKLNDVRDLEEITKLGIPKKALQCLAAYLSDGPKLEIIYKIIPEATYKRNQKLSPEVGEKTVRLARLISLSNYILGARSSAMAFLNKPHRLLDNRMPFEAALSEIGARRVEDILWKIFYGIPV